MSFEATKWAMQQRGLSPAAKIVLLNLCDRYNPKFGCFPSQGLLAHDCEISRSALNRYLNSLEKSGHVRRVRRLDPATKRQRSTRYILGFEGDGNESSNKKTSSETPAKSRTTDAAVTESTTSPCPKIGQTRVSEMDTNLVKEPIKKMGSDEGICKSFLEDILKVLLITDLSNLSKWWQLHRAAPHILGWKNDLGLTGEEILNVAVKFRRKHPQPPDGPKALDRAMKRVANQNRRQRVKTNGKFDGLAKPAATLDETAAYYAHWVNSEKYLPPSAISNSIRRTLLSRGLVTEEKLRARGVS